MRSRLLKHVRCKNGFAVSSIGKVGLLFGFNDSIYQTTVILITPFE